MTKIVKGHPGYAISSNGTVTSYKGREPKELKPDYSTGHPRVTIDGRKYYITHLVAERFLKRPTNPDLKIFHIDGDIENCNVENLCYLSQSDIQRYSHYTIEYRKQILGDRDLQETYKSRT